MALQPYDETGAMGGLFAPAFIFGDPISEAAVKRWNAAHLKTSPKPDVYSSPTKPNDQRDAIVQALLSGSVPAYGSSTDAGGLGLGMAGGAPETSTSTPASTPLGYVDQYDTPSSTAQSLTHAANNPSNEPLDNEDQPANDPNSQTNLESLTATPVGSTSTTTGGPQTTNDQAVLDAQKDALLAANDPVQGPTGHQGPTGTPNLGFHLGPNYGYGVNPSKGGPPTPIDPTPAAQAPAAPSAPSAHAAPGTMSSIDPTTAAGSVLGGNLGTPSPMGFGPVSALSPANTTGTATIGSQPLGPIDSVPGYGANAPAAVVGALSANNSMGLGTPTGYGNAPSDINGNPAGLGGVQGLGGGYSGSVGDAPDGGNDGFGGFGFGGGYGVDIGPAGALGPGTGMGIDAQGMGMGGNQAAIDVAMGNPGLGGYGGVTGSGVDLSAPAPGGFGTYGGGSLASAVDDAVSAEANSGAQANADTSLDSDSGW